MPASKSVPSVNRVAKVEAAPTAPTTISLTRLEIAQTTFHLRGLTPVIPHRWSEKAKRAMLEKQQGTRGSARKAREPKNPEQDAMDSCYWIDEEKTRPAMPATAFKAAIVGACRLFEGVTMTLAKTLIYVVGEGEEQLVEVFGKPTTFESTPRNASGVPDLRYRKRIFPWKATLLVKFPPSLIDAASLAALVDAAGHGGVGDWRPSSPKSLTGTFGTWELDVDGE